MKFNTNTLLDDLINDTQQIISTIKTMREISLNELNHKKELNQWSALECIEHLNLYGDFYLPEIRKSIKANTSPPSEIHKSSFLGEYFVKSMKPKKQLNKMKTFDDKNPIGSQLDKSSIQRFLQQQTDIISLLQQAKRVNITKNKTALTISKFIKLRLGDTFRFVIAHNQRHLNQAKRALIKI